MHYKRRPYRKRTSDYLKPFFIIVIFAAIIIFGWRALNNNLEGTSETTNEKVYLNIESGNVKAMTIDKNEWQDAPDNIYLYRGEKLKTGVDSRVSLTFFEQSLVRLDTKSEIALALLKKKNEINKIEIKLEKGSLWNKVEKMTNTDSNFSITTDLLTIDSNGGVFEVSASGEVHVIKGNVQVGIKDDDKIIKTINLGVGQEITIDSEALNKIKNDENIELISALSDSFKESNWYLWNMKKDGAIVAFEESEENEIDDETVETQDLASKNEDDNKDEEKEDDEILNADRLAYVVKPAKNSATNQGSISMEGFFDPEKITGVYIQGKKASITSKNKWKIYELKLNREGKNTLTIEAEKKSGEKVALESFEIEYDKTPPATPVITEPEGTDEPVIIKDIEQIITGTVDRDTDAVIVNDYQLGKYVPGSKEFKYYAKTEYENLEVGENEYVIFAKDKAGNKSDEVKVVLILEEETVETQDLASDDNKEAPNSTPSATSTGGVKITSPNNGENLKSSEAEFKITGDVPSDTVKVLVNNYQLQAYEAGDLTFTYRASSAMGNLTIGKKNTYTAKAYDKDDKLIGSANITIDVESGSEAAPTITIPTADATYTTTLDQITIGGTVGKWAQKVYLNGEFINEYIPGSGKWRKTVTLQKGENVFKIYSEKDGVKSGSDSITVNY